MRAARATLCQKKKRRICPSPPLFRGDGRHDDALGVDHLAHHAAGAVGGARSDIGFRAQLLGVIRCRLPNSAFDDVSEPVSATPSQPRSGAKNGYDQPVLVKASPSVASLPLYLVTKASANMQAIVSSAQRILQQRVDELPRKRGGPEFAAKTPTAPPPEKCRCRWSIAS